MMYRAAPDGVLRFVRLDTMTAIYDRRANATHVVAEVVPVILDALGQDACELQALADKLETAETGALAARLDELVATGLVERV